MNGTVPAASILSMALSGMVGYAIPIVLLLYLRKKKGADLLPFFIGCAVMLVFALLLESAAHRIILSSPAGAVIRNTLWLYALYGGFMAGLFEETGRFVAFKTVLRRQDKNVDALMYGAGHGGFESAALLGTTMINNIIWAVMINSGNTAALTDALTGDALTQAQTSIQTLITAPSYQFLLGGVERILAVALQMALSVLVWFAARDQRRWYLYPAAILIHLVVDTSVVLLSGHNIPLPAIEAVIAVLSALTAALAKRIWIMETN